jgi:hypothetical protein
MIFFKIYLKKKRFYTGKQTNDAQTHGYHAIAARIAIQQTPNTLNRAIITTLFSSYNNPTSTSVMQIATVVSLGPKTNRKKYNSQVQGAALLHFYKVAV